MVPISTKVLQITILDIIDWDINKCQCSKENSSLEPNSYLHNQMHDISKYLKKEGRKILILSQELQKDNKSFQTLSPFGAGRVSIFNMNT